MSGTKILVVEDDKSLQKVLDYNLRGEGYDVVSATDGARALDLARAEKPDLVILDIMLPELSGLEVARVLRREATVPIIMLTAKIEEVDRIVGLEVGADDYVTKPFSMRELVARVKAVLRRVDMLKQEAHGGGADGTAQAVRAGRIEIDLAGRSVTIGGSAIDLSRKEFDLLAFLVKNRGQVFSRDELLEKVWGYDCAVDTRTVDVHVSWLRRKIEADHAHPTQVLTVRGVGYKFEA